MRSIYLQPQSISRRYDADNRDTCRTKLRNRTTDMQIQG